MIRPGEVYAADFPEAGRHPVVIVSREELNRGRHLLVAFCTSSRFEERSGPPNCVPFRAGEFGFTADCVAQCENLLSIPKTQIDFAGGPLGVLDETALRDLIRAIGHAIEADCEPI